MVCRVFKGVVIKAKMLKTITVRVDRRVQHKKYGKILLRTSVVKAHDDKSVCRVGDIVLITESRPISKTKRFMLTKIINNVS